MDSMINGLLGVCIIAMLGMCQHRQDWTSPTIYGVWLVCATSTVILGVAAAAVGFIVIYAPCFMYPGPCQ